MYLHDQGVQFDELLLASDVVVDVTTPAQITTAGAVTHVAENLLRGVLVRDPNGAARLDVLPTAALLVAAVTAKYGMAKVGMMIRCYIVNAADAAEALTFTLGAGMTSGVTPGSSFTVGVLAGNSRRLLIRLTNVTAGSEAAVVYM